jgi:hypothetical protein
MIIEAFESLVVRLPASGYGTIEFAMSDARREALIAAGRAETQRFFDRPVSLVLGAEATSGVDIAGYADKVATKILSR